MEYEIFKLNSGLFAKAAVGSNQADISKDENSWFAQIGGP
jgi:hypothetical protein